MSVMFGHWKREGKPVDEDRLREIEALLAPYAPDSCSRYCDGEMQLVYRGFHATRESQNEKQPVLALDGSVIVWDGRLDNRRELAQEIGAGLPSDCADVDLISAAYQRFGLECFGRLIGDWAVSIWDPKSRTLLLAKDPIGIRPLYFAAGPDEVMWSSVIEMLLKFAPTCLQLSESYIAGCLSWFPTAELTPYENIAAVPPSSLVRLYRGSCFTSKYWDFNPARRIRYADDREYEEHFRSVLEKSVLRRLRSRKPVLAELSGGVDSSSIVCVADRLIAEGLPPAPRLDTVSYYDDTEPNWNERPYFTKIEELRKRTGVHINCNSAGDENLFPFGTDRLAGTPAGLGRPASAISEAMRTQDNAVLLSGIGGDEVLGGVPTPVPELADLFARLRWSALFGQMQAWALAKRIPLLHVAGETIRSFLPPSLGMPNDLKAPAWIASSFARRHRKTLTGFYTRTNLFGALPSFQETVKTIDGLRRQIACTPLPSEPAYEKRYPYLDRDLLEFVLAIPRGQLVRPGQRRWLMRRALTGIVPDEILFRKRKAFAIRGPLIRVARTADCIFHDNDADRSLLERMQVIDSAAFRKTLQLVRQGEETRLVPVIRALAVEAWLRHLLARGLRPHLLEELASKQPPHRTAASSKLSAFSAEN
jgi:asparagine synthase (glutamine-hydrolysing)